MMRLAILKQAFWCLEVGPQAAARRLLAAEASILACTGVDKCHLPLIYSFVTLPAHATLGTRKAKAWLLAATSESNVAQLSPDLVAPSSAALLCIDFKAQESKVALGKRSEPASAVLEEPVSATPSRTGPEPW